MRTVRNVRVVVDGDSMRPALRPGDRLLAVPVPRRWLRPGDLVVVRDPRERGRHLIKRLVTRDGHHAYVTGDAPLASTDSRSFGLVPLPALVRRAVYRYAPAGRVGGVRATAPDNAAAGAPVDGAAARR